MEDILKTTLLEFEKSAFLIDLVKHNNGKQYIRILQTIQDEVSIKNRAIKINPSILSDLLRVLNSYQELIPNEKKKYQEKLETSKTKFHARTISDLEKEEIKTRYLRGVPIPDLTIQFDCKAELIEQILYNNNIKIVSGKPPKFFYYRKFKLKRKR